MKQLGQCSREKSYCAGQALIELAVFGSIILFALGVFLQYAIGINYKQWLDMTTFRKAVALAIARNNKGVEPNVNLVVIKDKSIPAPDDPHGLRDSSPYSSQASATVSDLLYFEPSSNDPDALPGVDIVVNKDFLTRDGTQPEESLTASDRPSYSTIGWRTISNPCDANQVYRHKITTNKAVWWEWEDLPCGKVTEGQRVDVDNDFIEETVTDIAQNPPVYDDYGNQISGGETSWTIMDPKMGDINPEYGKPDPDRKAIVPYKETIDGNEVTVNQGMQPGYTKDTNVDEKGTYIRRIESKTDITTIESVNSTESIKRKIRFSPRTLAPPEELPERTVKSDLSQQSTKTYTTPF